MKSPVRLHKLRVYTVTAFIILALSGSFTHISWGTPLTLGHGWLSTICPLGYLETVVASKTMVSRLLIGLGLTLLATYILGRVFCAWVCPIPFVRSWFTRNKRPKIETAEEPLPTSAATKTEVPHTSEEGKPIHRDTRFYVLGGTLLSTAIFGFPVFCLICPIGLFFGTLYALLRLVRFNEPTISLLIFPAILIVEIVLLRKWCSHICPLGALFSLVSRFNKTFVPKVTKKSCLMNNHGISCHICKQVCPEEVDLHTIDPDMGSCTKCGECIDACPGKAIHFITGNDNDLITTQPVASDSE